jgi:hypothetical protein
MVYEEKEASIVTRIKIKDVLMDGWMVIGV